MQDNPKTITANINCNVIESEQGAQIEVSVNYGIKTMYDVIIMRKVLVKALESLDESLHKYMPEETSHAKEISKEDAIIYLRKTPITFPTQYNL